MTADEHADERERLEAWAQKRWLPVKRTPEMTECYDDGDVQMAWMAWQASAEQARAAERTLTFDAFRKANVARCLKWHPAGIASWSPSDWLTAVTGELGELASLLKMRNRERDGLSGNKFSPTQKQIADELADVLTYLDLLAEVLGVDLGRAAVEKFNEVSQRVGFPDRIDLAAIRSGQSAEGMVSVPVIAEIAAERKRQIDKEGWTPEHDDQHEPGAMAVAAACYALAFKRAALAVSTVRVGDLWEWTGWSSAWFKPKDRRRDLVRAAALIIAEIERLDRA